MTAWTLLILACLGDRCATHQLLLERLPPAPPEAKAAAMPIAALWSLQHPDLRVERWWLEKGIGA